MSTEQSRNIGLDLCRTIAILAVVFGHMLNHSEPLASLRGLGFIGLFGVDLFFCLSGFLIGRILITDSQTWGTSPNAGLVRFWYRRWMRTLPLYFFFLLVWLKWDWQGATTLGEQLPYLVFAQNLAWPMTDFYLLTWSLAVEEWFYFLFPLLLLAFVGFGTSARRGVLFAILGFIVLPFIARIFVSEQISGAIHFDEGVRHIVIYRLDAIGFGVAMAYLYCLHRPVFEKIGTLWYLFVIPLVLVIAMPKMGYPYFAHNALGLSIYLTVSGAVFAGVIPFFNNMRVSRTTLVTRFILLTSKLSYSMYLGHIIAFIFAIRLLKWAGLYEAIYPNPWITYPLFTLATFALAAGTYHLVERPFLWLRDRNS